MFFCFLLFYSIFYCLFFIPAFLRVFILFISLFLFTFFFQLFLFLSQLSSSFEFFSVSYKLEFINLLYILSFDSLVLYFILLTLLLFMICVLLVWNLKYKLREFLLLLLILNLLLINVFAVLDLVFFYIFFEAILIPMFLIVGVWGSRERRVSAAYQFFLYTLLGSLFMLVSIFFLYSHYGTLDVRVFLNFSATGVRQFFLWLLFFIAIAVKVPMFPVHIWLPEAHVEAPTAGSVILAGILLKLGLFAFLKFVISVFPFASVVYTPFVILLALLGLVYASFSTLTQIDIKKMVAYSSIAHMNFAVLGLFAFNFYGIVGAIALMLSHGLVSSGLFLCVGVLYERYKTRLFLYYGGLIRLMPLFSSLFFVLMLGNMGFPGTLNFLSELLIFFGLIFLNFFVCFLSGSTMVFSAAYSIALYNHVIFGNLHSFFIYSYSDLSKREFLMLFILVFLTVFLGIFSNLVMYPIEGGISLYLDLILYNIFNISV